jgi:hypothetical protein
MKLMWRIWPASADGSNRNPTISSVYDVYYHNFLLLMYDRLNPLYKSDTSFSRIWVTEKIYIRLTWWKFLKTLRGVSLRITWRFALLSCLFCTANICRTPMAAEFFIKNYWRGGRRSGRIGKLSYAGSWNYAWEPCSAKAFVGIGSSG